MSADALLTRLDGVKRTGSGRWLAKCPAHNDKRASLAVRELDDGRVLVHDFAGCDTETVLASVGLTFDALFPERALDHQVKRERRPFSPADILEAVALESLIASVAASTLARGELLSDTDRERLLTASARLGAAAEMGRAT